MKGAEKTPLIICVFFAKTIKTKTKQNVIFLQPWVAGIYAVAINHCPKSLVKVQLGFFMQKKSFFLAKVFLNVQNANVKTYRQFSAKRIVRIMRISE